MLRFLNDAIRFQKCPSLVLLRLIIAVKQEIGKTNDANYQKRGKTKDNVLLCTFAKSNTTKSTYDSTSKSNDSFSNKLFVIAIQMPPTH